MKTKAIVVSLVCLLAVLFLPSVGRAQETDCATPVQLVPDGRVLDIFLASGSTFWFRISGNAGRSYNIEITSKFGNTLVGGPTVFAPGDVTLAGCTGVSSLTVNVTTFADPELGGQGRGRGFVATTGGDYLVSLPGNNETNQISVSDTTLFNPLWSTFGGFETFYKIYNTTADSCSVTLDLRNDNDSARASVTFNLAANNTSATRTTGPTDLNVANDVAGHAFITHNCPPGAIQVDGFLGLFGAQTNVLPIKILGAREAQK